LDSQELIEIDASARAIVRRAYDLGRSEALKKVVEVLGTDRPADDQLALMGPAAEATPPPPPVHENVMNGVEPVEKKKPWWAWLIR
jgi:hypothetical protein